jgi:hypothetical protein
MFHPVVTSILVYYKYYPIIYAFVCAYHIYGYYEYTKVINHFIKLMIGKRKPPIPKEQDYEWIFIEEEILDDDDTYFDLNMMIMITEPEPTTTDIEGEEPTTDYDFVEIPL